jgi:hypothetical protein
MTCKEAKELSLEVWRYLAEHPEIARKGDLPAPLWKKIMHLRCYCPLCELFFISGSSSCPGCPLSGKDYRCESHGQPYSGWHWAGPKAVRKEAAEEIVRRIGAWEVEE